MNNARKKNDLTGFIGYATQGLRDGLEESMDIMQEGQLKVFWRNHIYEAFADIPYMKKKVFKRKRILALNAPIDKWSSMHEIAFGNPEISKEYAVLTENTLKRDFIELIKRELVIKKGSNYRANIKELFTYFPERK